MIPCRHRQPQSNQGAAPPQIVARLLAVLEAEEHKGEGVMKKILIGKSLFLFIICVLFSTDAIADMATFDCKFYVSKTIKYKDNEFTNEPNNDTLDINFIYDYQSQKSYMNGNAGTVETGCVSTGNNVSFIQSTANQNLQTYITSTTTIFLNYDNNGTYPAIHSRHLSFGTFSIVSSMYYGFCRLK